MSIVEKYNRGRARVEVHASRLNRHLERYVDEAKEDLGDDRTARLEKIRIQAQEELDSLLDEHETLGRLHRQMEMAKLRGQF